VRVGPHGSFVDDIVSHLDGAVVDDHILDLPFDE